ncbi:ATPase, T2SS/T4P/T4SS family [Gracilibacillus sp. JCM 18860]|uniref:ATPase, T2SS/T4P/T4SS family n=1 Tax=Gracilibacillus sp. JCM 18860 TaxID=1306159 RepID=UPI000AA20659
MNHATILSNQILHTAIEQNASDIHYIPKESKIDIYFRVIGKRQFFKQLSLQAYTTILAYYKFISNMDIGETRKPPARSHIHFLQEPKILLKAFLFTY